jgi:RimJ/RimL family protein N-acetyltransferase
MSRPILIDLPAELQTERLILRAPRAGDGPAINRAIVESFAELKEWLPWAQTLPSVDDSEQFARESHAKYVRREDLPMIFLRAADGEFLGGSGLHRIEWSVPRFEIGYWCRTSCVGHGYVAEAVVALTRLAFTSLNARRVEIRCDERNLRSRRVAERVGFELEGRLRRDSLGPDGSARNTLVYSLISLDRLKLRST